MGAGAEIMPHGTEESGGSGGGGRGDGGGTGSVNRDLSDVGRPVRSRRDASPPRVRRGRDKSTAEVRCRHRLPLPLRLQMAPTLRRWGARATQPQLYLLLPPPPVAVSTQLHQTRPLTGQLAATSVPVAATRADAAVPTAASRQGCSKLKKTCPSPRRKGCHELRHLRSCNPGLRCHRPCRNGWQLPAHVMGRRGALPVTPAKTAKRPPRRATQNGAHDSRYGKRVQMATSARLGSAVIRWSAVTRFLSALPWEAAHACAASAGAASVLTAV